MAEGFLPMDVTTSLDLSEVQPGQGKRLWLFRVPQHVATQSLEGARIKLPRKSREGKVLGRLGSDEPNGTAGRVKKAGAGLLFRAADGMESASFRALLSACDENRSLAVSGAFAGQVNVSLAPPPLEELGQEQGEYLARLVEPYMGRPQLKGMRVRAKLAGAGTEYNKRSRPGVQSTPSRSKSALDGGVGDDNGVDPQSGNDTAIRKFELKEEAVQEELDTVGSPKRKKKKKKRLSDVCVAGTEEGGVGQTQGPSTALKAKKSKKRDRLSL